MLAARRNEQMRWTESRVVLQKCKERGSQHPLFRAQGFGIPVVTSTGA